jgi:type I restriction enzyme S subunit
VDPGSMPPATPYVGLENIDADTGEARSLSVAEARIRSKKFVFSENHVLFGKLRPYLRKISRPTFSGVCSTDIVPLLPSAAVDRDYLFHFLRQPSVVAMTAQRSKGANLPRIAPSILADLLLPLPRLQEQHRIATILDKAHELQKKREESLALRRSLDSAAFSAVFGDPAKNDRGWPMQSLGEIATIRRGASPRPIQKYLGGSVPWIKIGDATSVDSLYIERTEDHVTEAGAAKSVFLEPGAIVVANSRVSLGFARILATAGCIHDGWLSIENLDGSVRPIYFVCLINTLTAFLRRAAPSGTQPNLNTTIMRNLRIPVPPLALQDRFAVFVEGARALGISTKIAEQRTAQLGVVLASSAFA